MKQLYKEINIPVIAIYDEETNEPICARWFCNVNSLKCKFLLFRKFGTQAVCGFGEQIDLNETTSREFIKPKEDCIIHKTPV